MDFRDFKSGRDDQGRRLDKVLRIFLPSLSLSQIYKALRKNLIKVNGKKINPDYKINAEDTINIASFLFDEHEKTWDKGLSVDSKNMTESKNEKADLDFLKSLIVFENENLLILNKPSGLKVHSSQKKEVSLQSLVFEYYLKTHDNDSLAFKPGPLHRIDRYTQGLVCFSMSIQGAVWFSENIKNHNIKKTYSAIVEGKISESQVWKDKLFKDDKSSKNAFYTVKIDSKNQNDNSLECITRIIPVKSFVVDDKSLTLVNFIIETGRQHQIRAQSSFHGFPLYGDTAYGGEKNKIKGQNFYLTAGKLEFPKNQLGIPPVIELKEESLSEKLFIV